MKTMTCIGLLLMSTVVLTCDTSQEKTSKAEVASVPEIASELGPRLEAETAPIGQYVTELFEDSKGHVWFGTLGEGVVQYTGTSIRYWTTNDGLVANTVVSMVEDSKGHLWFGTQNGLSRFDGLRFTNYSEADGLCHFRISGMLIDSRDHFWIGTWGGVCRWDGESFTKFDLPESPAILASYQNTTEWITEIMEDPHGNIWIGTDGKGAYKFDGASFSILTEADGLLSNNIQAIEADGPEQLWIGTRVAERDHPEPAKRKGEGGLNLYTLNEMRAFLEQQGLHHSDVYDIYKSPTKGLWVSTTQDGVYHFNAGAWERIQFNPDATSKNLPVMGIFEDSKGRIWFGCAGGLYRLDGNRIIHVTQGAGWPHQTGC